LGHCIKAKGAIRLPDGKEMGRKQLFLKAIELEPTFSMSYVRLGKAVEGGSAKLPDGTELTEQQLYLKAIELDAKNWRAFDALNHAITSADAIVELPDGSKVTKKDINLKVVHMAPNHAEGWINLGMMLKMNETIKLLDGTEVSKRKIFERALKLDPENTLAMNQLEHFCGVEETRDVSVGSVGAAVEGQPHDAVPHTFVYFVSKSVINTVKRIDGRLCH
jgi:hypothetical protein